MAAIVSDDHGESAWYGARLAVVDVAGGSDRTILETDVQLGWVQASPDGRHVAVVEALCSDRLVVAGELLLLDPRTVTSCGWTRRRSTWPDSRGATTTT